MRLLVRFVDTGNRRGFLPSLRMQFLATGLALLIGGPVHQSAQCLAAAAGSPIGSISGKYREGIRSQ